MNLRSFLFATCLVFLQRFSFAEMIDGELTVDGTVRTYHLFTPDHFDSNKKHPLVIMLHGGGGTGQDMIRFTHFNDLAERDTFLVVYPDGWHQGWNDHRVGEKLPQAQDDVKFISMLIDELEKDHHADSSKVFATGISNGAIFSLFLAQELSEKIRAIAPVCGSIPANYAATYHIDHPVSILIINGTADHLVKYEGGPVSKHRDRGEVISTDSMIFILTRKYFCKAPVRKEDFADINLRDGCRAERFYYPSCGDPSRVELIKVVGGGHTWPGGLQYLPKFMVGKVCRDFNATSEIWNFFRAQTSER